MLGVSMNSDCLQFDPSTMETSGYLPVPAGWAMLHVNQKAVMCLHLRAWEFIPFDSTILAATSNVEGSRPRPPRPGFLCLLTLLQTLAPKPLTRSARCTELLVQQAAPHAICSRVDPCPPHSPLERRASGRMGEAVGGCRCRVLSCPAST